jgi:hypothetical protein
MTLEFQGARQITDLIDVTFILAMTRRLNGGDCITMLQRYSYHCLFHFLVKVRNLNFDFSCTDSCLLTTDVVANNGLSRYSMSGCRFIQTCKARCQYQDLVIGFDAKYQAAALIDQNEGGDALFNWQSFLSS